MFYMSLNREIKKKIHDLKVNGEIANRFSRSKSSIQKIISSLEKQSHKYGPKVKLSNILNRDIKNWLNNIN